MNRISKQDQIEFLLAFGTIQHPEQQQQNKQVESSICWRFRGMYQPISNCNVLTTLQMTSHCPHGALVGVDCSSILCWFFGLYGKFQCLSSSPEANTLFYSNNFPPILHSRRLLVRTRDTAGTFKLQAKAIIQF